MRGPIDSQWGLCYGDEVWGLRINQKKLSFRKRRNRIYCRMIKELPDKMKKKLYFSYIMKYEGQNHPKSGKMIKLSIDKQGKEKVASSDCTLILCSKGNGK